MRRSQSACRASRRDGAPARMGHEVCRATMDSAQQTHLAWSLFIPRVLNTPRYTERFSVGHLLHLQLRKNLRTSRAHPTLAPHGPKRSRTQGQVVGTKQNSSGIPSKEGVLLDLHIFNYVSIFLLPFLLSSCFVVSYFILHDLIFFRSSAFCGQ